MINKAKILMETERLELVLPDISYLDKMVEHMKKNRLHFKASIPVSEKFYTVDFWTEKLKQIPEDFHMNKELHLILQEKNNGQNIIGSFCFDAIVRGAFQACYLGYRMDKDHVKKGYMFEALSASIQYVQNEWKIHRIMANYRPENTASGKLLEKLGFTIEGYAKRYLFLEGAWQDHILTSLTNNLIDNIEIYKPS